MKKLYMAYCIIFTLLIIGLIFDSSIVKFIAENRISFLNEFMIWISFFGTWAFVLIFMTSLFLFSENKRDWLIRLWLSVIASAIVVYALKIVFFRARPFSVLEILPLTQAEGSGFPSGHATAVFSTLAILDKEFPKLKWFWLGFACLVAFSRLYLGLHYLTDVVAGALIGFTISLIFARYKLFDFNKKKRKQKRKMRKK